MNRRGKFVQEGSCAGVWWCVVRLGSRTSQNTKHCLTTSINASAFSVSRVSRWQVKSWNSEHNKTGWSVLRVVKSKTHTGMCVQHPILSPPPSHCVSGCASYRYDSLQQHTQFSDDQLQELSRVRVPPYMRLLYVNEQPPSLQLTHFPCLPQKQVNIIIET